MSLAKPPPVVLDTIEIARRFNSKEQASQYAKQNGYERYKPYPIEDSQFVLKSLFHPVLFIK